MNDNDETVNRDADVVDVTFIPTPAVSYIDFSSCADITATATLSTYSLASPGEITVSWDGVPTLSDVEVLASRITALEEKLSAMEGIKMPEDKLTECQLMVRETWDHNTAYERAMKIVE